MNMVCVCVCVIGVKVSVVTLGPAFAPNARKHANKNARTKLFRKKLRFAHLVVDPSFVEFAPLPLY